MQSQPRRRPSGGVEIIAMKLVAICVGMAAGRAMEHLLEANDRLYDITVFGSEPRGNYNRIMLSPVLSDEKTYEEIVTHDADWYRDHGVDCRFGEMITSLDLVRKVVTSKKARRSVTSCGSAWAPPPSSCRCRGAILTAQWPIGTSAM